MFRTTIWYFAILCVMVESKISETSIRKFPTKKKILVPVLETDRLVKTPFAIKKWEAKTKEVKLIKRGIVLVDDDFDVPSAIYAHENKSRIDASLRTDISDKNEGSGVDVSGESESHKITKHYTLEQPENYSISVLPSKEEIKVTAETSILPDEDSSVEKESHTTTKHYTKEQPENYSISMLPTKKELKVTADTSILTDADSSGDGIVIDTTEYSIKITPKRPTEFPLHETIPDICNNSTCNHDDLFTSSSHSSSIIAEGTNITLSCKTNSNHSMLYWYKSNGTMYFLQAFSIDKELHFNIPDSKPVHSGMYKCVKWLNEQTCCNLNTQLSVYEMPLYTYHLIILGLIAAASLILCIFLSVRRTIKFKSYTKQFVEKHGKTKQLL